MPTVLIAGGTGTIGKRLQQLLTARKYEVIILSRQTGSKKPAVPQTAYAHWDPAKGEIDREAVASADYIINLSGAGVAEQRWTARRKRAILESRTQSCALLVKALQEIPNKVKAVVSASASGYYGPDTRQSLSKGFSEDDPPATDFLAAVCRKWEESIQPVRELGKRLVILRTGIVLSRNGGAFTEFMKPFRFGVAAILGSGRQMVCWIHEDDICNMYIRALEHETMSGPYNAVAPAAVTNKELVLALAAARRRFYVPVHVPAFALRIALGEMSVEVLKSSHLSAARIQQSGYQFAFPDIRSAAQHLVAPRT